MQLGEIFSFLSLETRRRSLEDFPSYPPFANVMTQISDHEKRNLIFFEKDQLFIVVCKDIVR